MAAARALLEVVRLSTGYLQAHGSASPRLDAELLAARALGMRRLDIYLQFERPLAEPELAAIRELVRRRGAGEPVAYITGEREFYGRAFSVTRDVLVPRPETELLVSLALAEARRRGGDVRIADLGTGSGAIAISLAAELPNSEIVAGDVSGAALAVAASNAARHGVEERVSFAEGAWAAPLDGQVFDIIVSNPPYVATAALATLDRDVRDFEPRLALDGGDDGLDAYRELLPGATACLAPQGWLGVEVDALTAGAVLTLAESLTGAAGDIHEDLGGQPRTVTISRA
ncbi:MAG: peptide chain release factor N(5)-glutamine methyltransferase [Candidatus Dormibacteria bacterium]